MNSHRRSALSMIEAKVRPIQGFQPGTGRPGGIPRRSARASPEMNCRCWLGVARLDSRNRIPSGERLAYSPPVFRVPARLQRAGDHMTVGEIQLTEGVGSAKTIHRWAYALTARQDLCTVWLDSRGTYATALDSSSSGSVSRRVRYSWMSLAAVLPAPIARITVALPVTISPPAQTPGRDVAPLSPATM